MMNMEEDYLFSSAGSNLSEDPRMNISYLLSSNESQMSDDMEVDEVKGKASTPSGRSSRTTRPNSTTSCEVDGCTKLSRGSSGLCVRHGGGKKCSYPVEGGCLKVAQGRSPFCKRHGGGNRCLFPQCHKSARGSTNFCAKHGAVPICAATSGCTNETLEHSALCFHHHEQQQVYLKRTQHMKMHEYHTVAQQVGLSGGMGLPVAPMPPLVPPQPPLPLANAGVRGIMLRGPPRLYD